MRAMAVRSCEKVLYRARHAFPIPGGEKVVTMEIHEVMRTSPEAFYHWVRIYDAPTVQSAPHILTVFDYSE